MNQKRHAAHCSVCSHAEVEAIEAKFLQWKSPRSLESRYGLPQTSVYRHAKAFNLYEKRQGNVLDVLERIIEKGVSELPELTASNLIEAIKTHAKLTGQWVDRTEDTAFKEFVKEIGEKGLYEMEYYQEHGCFPDEDDATMMDEPEHEQ